MRLLLGGYSQHTTGCDASGWDRNTGANSLSETQAAGMCAVQEAEEQLGRGGIISSPVWRNP